MNNTLSTKPLSHNEVKHTRAQRLTSRRRLPSWLGQVGQALQLQGAANYK